MYSGVSIVNYVVIVAPTIVIKPYLSTNYVLTESW